MNANDPSGWGELAQAAIALLLLGFSFLALPRAYARAWRYWSQPLDGSARLVIGAMVIGAVLRWAVAPLWIATVYIGYHLTQQAIDLFPIAHYGIGAAALYHALFGFLPHDHRVLMGANSAIGVLTLPLVATVGARVLDERRAGAVLAMMLALTPLFIRNDNSDANNVPCLWWLCAATVLLDEYLETAARFALAGSCGLATLAAIGRPEMPILVPLFLVVFASSTTPRPSLRPFWKDPLVAVACLCFALLVTPHLLHLRSEVSGLQERSSLPGLSLQRLTQLPFLLVHRDAVVERRMYPLGLLVLAAVGAIVGVIVPRPGSRRARLLLLALALFCVVVYAVDLDWANMARVHVPAALVTTVLASAGLVFLWDQLRYLALRAVLLVAVAATALPTARALWAPTNEALEDRLIRAATARLPDGEFTLVRIDREDRDRQFAESALTHTYFPDYLVTPPERQGAVSGIIHWLDHSDFSRPAYFFSGMRCYARFRRADEPRPHGDNLQSACALMRERFDLEPVVEWEVPNRGDVWLDYYGDTPTLRVGFYQIKPKSSKQGLNRFSQSRSESVRQTRAASPLDRLAQRVH